jgi:phospho-N-acetylmuramoyl-pentapeptide-transferase
MNTLLGFLLFSFTINAALIIPFIDLLYQLKFQRPTRNTADFMGTVNSIFNKLHKKKAGIPVGGGLLIIITTTLLFLGVSGMLTLVGADMHSVYPFKQEMNVIFATFILFGLLGLYDDVMKFFGNTGTRRVGISFRAKLIGQLILGGGIGWFLYRHMGISIINIPYLGVVDLGLFFIPLSAIVITGFSNAVNITDGLDGLASGLLMITLFALTMLATSILDTPITLFLALWIGGILAFLYFNTYPARIHLGDVGALSFGATLAVIGLLLGKIVAVFVIGGIFILEIATSAIQMFGKRYLGRKLLPISPFHLWLQSIGWEEPKIVARAWLAGIVLALFGLWLAFL